MPIESIVTEDTYTYDLTHAEISPYKRYSVFEIFTWTILASTFQILLRYNSIWSLFVHGGCFFISFSYNLNQYTNWLRVLAGEEYILIPYKVHSYPGFPLLTCFHSHSYTSNMYSFLSPIPSPLRFSNTGQTCALVTIYSLRFLTTCFGNLVNFLHCLLLKYILRWIITWNVHRGYRSEVPKSGVLPTVRGWAGLCFLLSCSPENPMRPHL